MKDDVDVEVERQILDLKTAGQWPIVRLTTYFLRKCDDIDKYGPVMRAAYDDDPLVVKYEMLVAIRKLDTIKYDVSYLMGILNHLEDKFFLNELVVKKSDDLLVFNIMVDINKYLGCKANGEWDEAHMNKENARLKIDSWIVALVEMAKRGERPDDLKVISGHFHHKELSQALRGDAEANLSFWAKSRVKE